MFKTLCSRSFFSLTFKNLPFYLHTGYFIDMEAIHRHNGCVCVCANVTKIEKSHHNHRANDDSIRFANYTFSKKSRNNRELSNKWHLTLFAWHSTTIVNQPSREIIIRNCQCMGTLVLLSHNFYINKQNVHVLII